MKMVLKQKLLTVFLLVLAGTCVAQPVTMSKGRGNNQGVDHVVSGYGWNNYGTGEWSQKYQVRVKRNGRVSGKVTTKLTEFATPDSDEFYWEWTNEINCFEYDETTGEVWLGGHLTKSNTADFPVGLYMVDYAKDGGPGGANDAHGDWVPSWFGGADTCEDRQGPFVADPVERGDIVIR